MNKQKAKARRPKKADLRRKPKYITQSPQDVWSIIENGHALTEHIDFYDETKEYKFYKTLHKGEDYRFCKEPYYNYAITTHGRVYSFKTEKYMKCSYQPNVVMITLNGNSNVRIKALFEIVGLEYNHEEVVNNLIKYKLINVK